MQKFSRIFFLLFFLASPLVRTAHSLELDFGGQFRAENVMIPNYTMGGSNNRDRTLEAQDGYYVPPSGKKKATFQQFFFRLNPKALVNDNVAIKSELWFGNPISGFYGRDPATGNGQQFFNTTSSNGSAVKAQRVWGEFQTDFGVVEVGRAPLDWGLGLVHSAGNGVFDRYQSTGDVARVRMKLGNFSVIPATTKYNDGGAYGGSLAGSTAGGSGLSEYSVALKYQSVEDGLEAGVNFIRRLAGGASTTKWINDTAGSMNMSIWDIYFKRKFNRLSFALEAPIYSGKLVSSTYSTYAIATETEYEASDSWVWRLKAGRAPGQGSDEFARRGASPINPSKYTAVYFHPNYRLGLIMFNYNLRALGGTPASGTPDITDPVDSIYDNPVSNANYALLQGVFRQERWQIGGKWIYAVADKTAQEGSKYFNVWDRKYSTNAATSTQDSSLGHEVDVNWDYLWDQSTTFGVDGGVFLPGAFYSFAGDSGNSLATKPVFALVMRVGVQF